MGIVESIGGALGAAIGREQARGDISQAEQNAARAFEELMSIGYPPDLSKEIILKQYESAGILTPELEQSVQSIGTEFESIQEDPALKSRQREALEMMRQSAATGMTPAAMAALNKAQRDQARDLNAKMQQMQMQRQAQGLGNSGLAQVEQMMAAQGASQALGEEQDRIAAQASQQALEAMRQSGGLAGDIRRQDYDVSSSRASAKDQMNRFNLENKMAQEQRRVATANQAQDYNLSNKQRLLDANVGQANKEKYRQADASRQFWDDMARRKQLRAGAYTGESDRFSKRADRTIGTSTSVGKGIGAIGEAYFSPTTAATGDTVSKMSNTSSPAPDVTEQNLDGYTSNYFNRPKSRLLYGDE